MKGAHQRLADGARPGPALPCPALPGAAVSPGEAPASPPGEGNRVRARGLGWGQLGQQPPPRTRAHGTRWLRPRRAHANTRSQPTNTRGVPSPIHPDAWHRPSRPEVRTRARAARHARLGCARTQRRGPRGPRCHAHVYVHTDTHTCGLVGMVSSYPCRRTTVNAGKPTARAATRAATQRPPPSTSTHPQAHNLSRIGPSSKDLLFPWARSPQR